MKFFPLRPKTFPLPKYILKIHSFHCIMCSKSHFQSLKTQITITLLLLYKNDSQIHVVIYSSLKICLVFYLHKWKLCCLHSIPFMFLLVLKLSHLEHAKNAMPNCKIILFFYYWDLYLHSWNLHAFIEGNKNLKIWVMAFREAPCHI